MLIKPEDWGDRFRLVSESPQSLVYTLTIRLDDIGRFFSIPISREFWTKEYQESVWNEIDEEDVIRLATVTPLTECIPEGDRALRAFEIKYEWVEAASKRTQNAFLSSLGMREEQVEIALKGDRKMPTVWIMVTPVFRSIPREIREAVISCVDRFAWETGFAVAFEQGTMLKMFASS